VNDFARVLPEACIALTLIFVLFAEITYYGERLRLVTTFSVMGLSAALIQVAIGYEQGNGFAFSNAVSVDGLSLFFKALFVVLAGFSVMAASRSTEIPAVRRPEFCTLVLTASLAMCLAAGSSELLLSFVALQAVNAVGLLLAGFGKRSMRSTEAGVKYLLLFSVSGACFLYASGILFSVTHSLNIYEIHKALVAAPLSRAQMLVVFMLFVISLGSQMAAFPLSLWAPDVIEGAPTPIAGFLSVGIPATGFAIAIRLFLATFTRASEMHGQWAVLGEFQWTEALSLFAGVTMVFGALLSLRQTSAKRMVGCLVVAQTGYYLMGILVLDEVGVAAVLYNLIVGLFALVGAFYVLSFFHDELGSDRLSDYRGVLRRAVPECICLVLFLLCVVGVPPLPGFLAKFTLIGVVIRHGQLSLAVALSTVTVSKLAFSLIGDFRTPSGKARWISPQRNMFLAAVLVPMFFVGIFAEFFLNWAGRSLGFIFW
jgi:proton-translocating NADH-quinone oxidoreductase chain N